MNDWNETAQTDLTARLTTIVLRIQSTQLLFCRLFGPLYRKSIYLFLPRDDKCIKENTFRSLSIVVTDRLHSTVWKQWRMRLQT